MNSLSYTTVRIESMHGDTSDGPGSAFLYADRDRQLWLVTACHNLTNRNAVSGMWMNDKLRLPTSIRFQVLIAEEPLGDGGVLLKGQSAEVEMYEVTAQGGRRAIWAHHPDGMTVDVAAIPLGCSTLGLHRPVNAPDPQFAAFPVDAGTHLDVLGYPMGLDGGAGFPLWKRGSVASEPDLVGSTFRIDAATREGLSGGPVFARRIGMFPDGPRHVVAGERRRFVGVYVGRDLKDDPGVLAQVGRVVKASEVARLIDNPQYFAPEG